MNKNTNLLVIGAPFGYTGGQLRAQRSIKAYADHGLSIKVIVPHSGVKMIYSDPKSSLSKINDMDRKIQYVGHVDLPSYIKNLSMFSYTIESFFPNLLRLSKSINFETEGVDGVLSLHENFDSIYFAIRLAKKLGIKSVALLQNPPFIENSQRRKNIEEIYRIYQDLIKKYIKISRGFLIRELHKKFINRKREYSSSKLLDMFDLIITVTKATAMDMGDKWIEKVVSLDPGVSLNTEDLGMIQRIRNSKVSKKNILIFSGGFDIYKGIIDAVLSFNLIKKDYKKMKLYITGRSRDPVLMRVIRKLINDLDLKNDIFFTGYLSREKLFRLKAEARMVIHPSHMDAFSYNVCESLYLGTPVVGYNIPALTLYYRDLQGIKLVNELDVEGLSIETVNLLEQKSVDVEIPHIPTWREIMNEEISLIGGLIQETQMEVAG